MSEQQPIVYASFDPASIADEGHLRTLAICHYIWGGLTIAFASLFIFYIVIGAMMNSGAVDKLLATKAWNVDGGGSWGTSTNWNGGIPASNADARFLNRLTRTNGTATIRTRPPSAFIATNTRRRPTAATSSS